MTDNLDNKDQNQNQNNEPPKTYTHEEFQKMLQSETDKRVTQGIETAKTKWQQEFEEKMKQERSEAEKLAKLNEKERFELELQKQKQAFEDEKKQFHMQKMELETIKELSTLNLPTDFAKYLLAEKSEAVKENITNFKTHWESAIEKAVNEKLQGTTPRQSTKKDGANVTKEQFQKMSYKERMEIFANDKELYNQLKG